MIAIRLLLIELGIGKSLFSMGRSSENPCILQPTFKGLPLMFSIHLPSGPIFGLFDPPISHQTSMSLSISLISALVIHPTW
jgi:hypothetical protein